MAILLHLLNRWPSPIENLGTIHEQNLGVIRQDLENLDSKFDTFTGAVATLMSLQDDEDRDRYEGHMVVWTEYYGRMKDQEDEVINIIDPANRVEIMPQTAKLKLCRKI